MRTKEEALARKEVAMDSWHSYPSIYALGHRALENLLTVPVDVEEKIDGSQFSFGVDDAGEIHVRSKGAVMVADAPEKMFSRAVDSVREIAPLLKRGWTYRAEYLMKPKHNTLAYGRTPRRHLILFDVNTGHEAYLPYAEKALEAERIGIEVVPLIYQGKVASVEQFRAFLDRDSVLGAVKIEGVVIKQTNPQLFGLDKKALIGKFVSEAFKEIHGKEWKRTNPTTGDILTQLGERYKTDARWGKAVQHLREQGKLADSPKDIGILLNEVIADIERECADDIREKLYAYAWPHIKRRVVSGLPEWYKNRLLESQFGGDKQDGAA